MTIRRRGVVLTGVALVIASLAVVGAPAGAATGGGGCQLQGTANLSPPLGSSSANFTYNFSGSLSGCQSNIAGAPTSGTVEAGRTITTPYNWNYTDSTTLAAAASAGSTTISTTASEGSVPTQAGGTVVTIDSGTGSAETRTVTAVSGTGPYTETLSSALSFSHAAGAAVAGAHSGSATATYQEPISTGNGSCGSSTTSGTAIADWSDGTTTVVSYQTTGALAAVNLQGTVVSSVDDTLASSTGPTQAPPAQTHTVNTTRYAGSSALGQLTFQPSTPDQNCVTVGVSTATINGFIGIGSAQ